MHLIVDEHPSIDSYKWSSVEWTVLSFFQSLDESEKEGGGGGEEGLD